MDHMTGKPFDKSTVMWIEGGKDPIGRVSSKPSIASTGVVVL
jgi:hypothetical protein